MDDMAKPPGLIQRGRIWYYRKRVPKDLVERYGKREIPLSLETEDYRTALGRFHEEAAKFEAEFAEIRRRREMFGGSSAPVGPADVLDVSEEEAIAIARALVVERLASYDRITAKEKTSFSQDALDDLRYEISGDIGNLRDRGSSEADHLVYLAAISAFKRNGYSIGHRQRVDRGVLDLVRRALVVIKQIELARIEGDFSDDPGDVLFAGLGSDDLLKVGEARKPKVSISSAIEMFWDQVISLEPKAPKTDVKYKAILRVIKSFFGAEAAIETVTREQCFAFRDAVAKLPPNYAKKKDAPPQGASLDEIIDYARANELPVMSYGTQALYVALMVRLFTWAGHERMTENLVVIDIKPRGKRPAKDELRGSFDGVQLAAIFNAPIYRGCKDDEYGFSTPGPNIIKRSRYWLPLIALFSGMREGEILSLNAANVRVNEYGTHYFDLSKRKGKNTYSRREVPVHSSLIKAGFLTFVDEKRKCEGGALFPDVPPGSDGTQTAIFSKRFATFLKACGIKDVDVKTCFHMLRHTMKDALDRGHVPENTSDGIQGWSRRMKTSRSYGQGFEAETLKPWIEKAALPKLDLSHITGSK
jgi:integrase